MNELQIEDGARWSPPQLLSGARSLRRRLWLQGEFLETIFAVQEHFGNRDPSEEEIHAFLRQRMIDQGKSAEEADRFLATMGDEPA